MIEEQKCAKQNDVGPRLEQNDRILIHLAGRLTLKLRRIIFRCGDICIIKHMTYQVFRLSQVIKSLALMFEDQKLSKKGLVYKKERSECFMNFFLV